MKRSAILCIFLLLVGCGGEVSTQQLLNPFLTTTEKEWNIVVFYEEEPIPQSEFQPLKSLLLRKGIQAHVKHQALDEEYETGLNVGDGSILIIDNQGIRFRSTDVHVLEGMVLQQLK
ncbi:hypothetical protein [Halobacillus salinus]|uniref:hypothetical protein n=1 Tax=Halobacillus salinus TaxID=192814 RepID=UPI0009A738CA|nr:hypothetical protein [Halobacillus salinus]